MVNKNKLFMLIISIAIIMVLSACSDKNSENDKDATYPNEFLLADVTWVENNLDNEKVIIIDSRSKGFDEGHIPGAVNFSSGQVNDPDHEVAGFIIDEATFTTKMQDIGINSDTTVLIYDGGDALSATRVFYALEYYGHQDKVKILNGGYAAWLTSGNDISFDEAQPAQGNFVAQANANLISTKEDVEKLLEDDNVVFLDARSQGEYTGTDLRGNERGGHIPKAVHCEWLEAIGTDEDGLQKFLSYNELSELFGHVGAVEGKTIVPYCQTNVRGAHSYFSLRLLGHTDVRPYEGSWAEWGNDTDTLIEI